VALFCVRERKWSLNGHSRPFTRVPLCAAAQRSLLLLTGSTTSDRHRCAVVRHPAEGCEIKGRTRLFEDCKTARSRCTITIPLFVVEALNEHRKSVGSIGMAKMLIFPGEHGAPPDYRTLVRLHFEHYRKAAKLPKCTPYVLRHSHISALLADGVPRRGGESESPARKRGDDLEHLCPRYRWRERSLGEGDRALCAVRRLALRVRSGK
jgi:hypothetical protein